MGWVLWGRGGVGQRARGSRHQGMGVGIDYIAKGFNFFKKKKHTPDSPDPHGSRMVQGKGVRIFSKGYRLLPNVSALLASLPHVPSFLVQL